MFLEQEHEQRLSACFPDRHIQSTMHVKQLADTECFPLVHSHTVRHQLLAYPDKLPEFSIGAYGLFLDAASIHNDLY